MADVVRDENGFTTMVTFCIAIVVFSLPCVWACAGSIGKGGSQKEESGGGREGEGEEEESQAKARTKKAKVLIHIWYIYQL